MTLQEEINEFMALTVSTMNDDTRIAWDSLSDFERKLTAANAFFFVKNYNEQQRIKALRNLRYAR